jgi:hypothetical protein
MRTWIIYGDEWNLQMDAGLSTKTKGQTGTFRDSFG